MGVLFVQKRKALEAKSAYFLKDFADLWLCGLWSIISKEDVLVYFAGCFFSFLGRLSVLLTPSARVSSLALFQLHNTVKPAKTKNIEMLMEALIVFNTLKRCLASVWGLTWAVNHVSGRERPMPPQPAPPQAPQHPAHDCEEISPLNSTLLHSLSPKNDTFVIIYSAHDVQNPYTNIN